MNSQENGFAERSADRPHGSSWPGIVLLIVMALCLVAGRAGAQTVDDAGADDIRIEEIVVRGQKREQTLKDTSASVAVYSEALISDLTFTELSDLYRFTPNVSSTDSSEGTFAIRGINFSGIGFAGVANAASLYVDGVFQSNLGIEGGPASVWDISQIEIYRGPQSTVQGRNALAGAVIVNTRDPGYEWDLKARGEVAEYGRQRYALAVGGPLVDEQLAFRVAVDSLSSDGFITNPVLDVDTIDEDDVLNMRGKLLWEPAGLEEFSAKLTYAYSEGTASTGFGQGTVDGPNFFDREVFFTNQTLQEIETSDIALELSYDLSDRFTIEWLNTFSDADEESAARFPPAPGDAIDVGTDSEDIFTSDLRLLVEGNRYRGVAGLYYFDKEQETNRNLVFALPFSTLDFTQTGGTETSNYALYFDGEYDLTDRVALLFGARLDEEEFSNNTRTITLWTPEVPAFGLVNSDTGTLDADSDFNAFLPKAGLRVDISGDSTLSFIVQRGYRSGGSGVSASGSAYEFDPEYTWNYEMLLRSSWLDGDLRLNAALFYTDWTDQQVLVGTFPDTSVENSGESELSGAEVDFNLRLSETLFLFGAVGLLSTEFNEFIDEGVDLSGNEFPLAPSLQGAIGLLYDSPSGFFASADLSFANTAFSDAENMPENRLDSRAVVNAKVGYNALDWSIKVFARNLFDEEYFVRLDAFDPRSLTGSGLANVGAPQVIGVEFTYGLGD